MPKTPQPSDKSGLLPKLKGFMESLSDRYHRVLQVIDEALASESLKDKIWAVDLILKKTPNPETVRKSTEKKLDPTTLAQMDDAELLRQIRGHLKDWEP